MMTSQTPIVWSTNSRVSIKWKPKNTTLSEQIILGTPDSTDTAYVVIASQVVRAKNAKLKCDL